MKQKKDEQKIPGAVERTISHYTWSFIASVKLQSKIRRKRQQLLWIIDIGRTSVLIYVKAVVLYNYGKDPFISRNS